MPSPGPQMVSKVRSGKSYDHSQGASAMSYSTGGGVGGSEQKASPSHPPWLSLAFLTVLSKAHMPSAPQ